jgi:hypothetical protein
MMMAYLEVSLAFWLAMRAWKCLYCSACVEESPSPLRVREERPLGSGLSLGQKGSSEGALLYTSDSMNSHGIKFKSQLLLDCYSWR